MSKDEIQSLHDKLDTITSALVGNKALGHKGLVERVDDAEKAIANHDRKLITWTGGFVAIAGTFGFVKDMLWHK